MRTTVTIPDDIIKETLKLAGVKKLSEAVVISLTEYIKIKKRLQLIESLASERPEVTTYSKIKKARKARQWSL